MDSNPLNKAKTPRQSMPGVISRDEAYVMDEFRGRMRWTKSAMRAAKKAGLKVSRVGKRDYILGNSAIEFLQSREANASLSAMDD